MKKIFQFLIVLLLGSFVYTGCDKIDQPYLELKNKPTPPPDTTKHYKKVLVEDFTGHKCTNCPKAHLEARNLQLLHPEKVIVISIHSGYFATADGSGHYTANYQTAEGTEITEEFNVVSYPSGMINRTKFDDKFLQGSDAWQSATESQLNTVAQAKLSLNTSWNNTTRTVSIETSTTFTESVSGKYNLCVVITEDSINSPQANSNSSVGPTPVIDPYYHRHVLRKAINGTWGDLLNTSLTVEAGTNFTKSYTFAIPQNWNANHCSIIAYIRQADEVAEKHNILQVEEAHVIHSK